MPEYAELIKLALSFGIVILMIYAIYYVLNRINPAFYLQKKGEIQIEQMQYVAKGKSLCLVKVGETKLLLAFDDKGISVLKEWDVTHNEEDTV